MHPDFATVYPVFKIHIGKYFWIIAKTINFAVGCHSQ